MNQRKSNPPNPGLSRSEEMCKNISQQELDDEANSWLSVCSVMPALEDQIHLLVKAIEVETLYFKHCLDMCTALETLAKETYPNVKITARPFGSSMTQLSLKNSDVDVFLDFGETPPESPEKLTRTLKRAISRRRHAFSNVVPIFARIPIVRCRHYSGITCDVSFSNALGVLNSELIAFYLSLDERIRPLILILKFWAKKQNLTGSNAVTSYALTLLVIFYLQQLDQPVVPSFHYLQASSLSSVVVADWETSFIKQKTLVVPTKNRMTLFELLRGFFQFYATFEFGIYVASTHVGRPVLKPLFAKPYLLPPEFALYKANLQKDPVNNKFDFVKGMCVQDPMKHSHNVTRNAPKKTVQRFAECAETALRLCEEEERRRTKKNHHSELLKELFRAGEEEGRKRVKRNEEIVVHLGSHLIFDGSVGHCEASLRKAWSDTVFKVLTDILTRVMKSRVKISSGETYDMSSCGPKEAAVAMVIACEVDHQLLSYKRRTQARQDFEFPKEMLVVEREEMISDYLLDTVLVDEPKLGLQLRLTYLLKKQPTRAVVELENLEKDNLRRAMVAETFLAMQMSVPRLIEATFQYIFSHA